MKNNALQYTFRVWVTSVLVSPFVFTLLLIIRQVLSVSELIDDGFRLVGMYIFLVVFQLLFSFVTWLVFLLLVNLIVYFTRSDLMVKPFIFCVGVLLAIATFMALDNFIGSPGDRDSFINLMYANCAGIGWAVWYYRLDTGNVKSTSSAE